MSWNGKREKVMQFHTDRRFCIDSNMSFIDFVDGDIHQLFMLSHSG